jgi:hypothetical protein
MSLPCEASNRREHLSMEFDEIYLRAGITIPPLTLKMGVLSVLWGKFFRRA